MLKRCLKSHWPLLILLLAFNLTFGWLLFLKWQQFHFGAYDLGIHDQILYLYSRTIFTPSSFTGFSAPFWDAHFRPTFIIFFLQYLFFPSPLLFIILQATVFSLGAIPVYLLALHLLKKRFLAVAFAFAYLVYPGALSALAFPGHSENLIATLVSFALFFYLKGLKKYFLVFYVLACVSQENVSFYLSGLCLFLFLRKDKKIALICLLFSTGWGLLWAKAIIPRVIDEGYIFLHRYYDTSVGLAPLVADPKEKVKTVVLSLLNFAFLSISAPTLLIPPVLSLAVRFLSFRQALWWMFYHYNVFLTPFLAYAAILGASALQQKIKPMLIKKVGEAVLALLLVLLPPAINWEFGYFQENYLSFKPFSKSDRARIEDLLSKIPSYAAVSAQDSLTPRLTQREKVYLLDEFQRAEYIPIDLALGFAPLTTLDGAILVRKLLESSDYQILECTDYSIIFKKGYRPVPQKECLEFRENLNLLR